MNNTYIRHALFALYILAILATATGWHFYWAAASCYAYWRYLTSDVGTR